MTGNDREEAIVVLHYQTGGAQNTDYVYIYSLESGKPKLLDFCYTGDRAYSGLYSVHGEDGLLVFDLLDPKSRSGTVVHPPLLKLGIDGMVADSFGLARSRTESRRSNQDSAP